MALLLAAFAATITIELAVLVLLAPASERARVATAVFALNAITHPLAFVFANDLGWWPVEGLVVVVETLLFALAGIAAWPRALAWSLLANAASASSVLLFT